MRALILAAAVLSMPLSGCAAIGPGLAILDAVTAAHPAAAIQDKVVLEGTRGLIIAHNAYQGIEAIVAPLVRARVFDATQVTMIETLSNQATALLAGTDARLTEAQRAAGVFTIVDQLSSIVAAARH